MPNARSLSNTINEANDFKCEIKCGDQTNNFAGIMFSQMIAHDTTSRKVVSWRGVDFWFYSNQNSLFSARFRIKAFNQSIYR